MEKQWVDKLLKQSADSTAKLLAGKEHTAEFIREVLEQRFVAAVLNMLPEEP